MSIFPSVTLLELGIIFLAVFLGGLVKGIIGLALPVIGIAVMITVLAPIKAIAIMVFPILLTNFSQAAQGGIEGWQGLAQRYWAMMATCVVVMFITSLNATAFSAQLLFLMIGMALLLFVGVNYAAPSLRLSPRYDRPASILAGFVSGVLGGATSVYGPPINMYLASLRLEKTEWIRAIGFSYALCGIPLIFGYGLNGMLNADTVPLSVIACVPAMLGLFLGRRIQHYIPQAAFRHLMFFALIVLGLHFIRRAILA